MGSEMCIRDRNETKLSFKPAAKRTALQTWGLTEECKVKSPTSNSKKTQIQLTDKGWEWCQDHLHETVDTKSPQVKVVLTGLLNALGRFFENQDDCNSLGEIFALAQQQEASTESAVQDSPAANTVVTVDQHQVTHDVLQACQQLSDDQPNVRIRLKDLRPLLPQYQRTQVDSVLAALQQEGRLQLWRLDDPTEITPQDAEAAITSAIGTQQHIVYLEGVLS